MGTVVPLPPIPAIRAIIERDEPGVVINLRPEFALIRFANAAMRHAEEARRMLDEQAEQVGELMR